MENHMDTNTQCKIIDAKHQLELAKSFFEYWMKRAGNGKSNRRLCLKSAAFWAKEINLREAELGLPKSTFFFAA
jgi:hypothetical protein